MENCNAGAWSDGNVGIGTTTPATNLHVEGNTSGTHTTLRLKNLNATGGIGAQIQLYDHDSFFYQTIVDGDLRFYNGAEIMILKSGGSVGIGSVTPQESLTISGNFRSNANEFRIKRSGTDIIYHSGATMKLSTSNVSALIIDGSQNVGLRVTPKAWHSSYAALQIGGLGCLSSYSVATATGDTKLTNNAYRATDGTWKRIYADYASEYTQYSYVAPHQFKVAGTAAADTAITWTTALTINTSGNVGIGTTAPTEKLDVKGSALVGDQTTSLGSSYQLQLSRSNDPRIAFRHLNAAGVGQADYMDFYFKDTGGTERLSARLLVNHSATHASQPGADFIFSTTPAGGSLTERMRINDDGNVGIGTTAPADLLHLYSATPSIILDKTETGWGALRFYKAGVQVSYISLDASEDMVYWQPGGSGSHQFYAGGAATLKIQNDGKVGIGTTAPGATLQIGTHSNTIPSNTALFVSINPIRFSTTNNNADYGSYLKPGYDAGPNPDVSVLTLGTRFSTTDTDVLTLYGNEVGIGETTPNSPLVVISPDNTDHNAIIGAYTNNLSVGVELHHYGLRGATTTADGSTALDTNQKLMLDAKGTGHLLLQTYGGTGNVGIGTTTPATLFDAKSSRTHNFIGRFVNTSTVGWGAYIEGGGDSGDYSLLIRNQASSDLFAIMGDGEIRVANQTLVDSASANYSMTFPNMGGIAMGSAYTYANIYGSGGDLYLKANAYPANLGATSKIYLVTANSSGGQAGNVVVNNGQLGIGIAAPATLLELSSNAVSATDIAASTLLRLTNTATALSGGDIIGALQFYNSDGSDDSPGVAASVYATAGSSGGSGRLEFRTKMQNSEGAPAGMTMFLNEVGKVGIATASPSALLHVQGTMRLTGGFYDKDNSLGSAGQILTTNGSATYWSAAGSGTISGSGTDNYVPRFNGTSALENSLIQDNGTGVGIGIAPNNSYMLRIDGNMLTGSGQWHYWGGSTVGIRDKSGTGLEFKTGSSTNVTILSDGNVGIGTGTPARKLHVLGGAVGVQARLSAPSGWGTGLEFYDGDGSGRHWRIGTSNNVAGDFTFMSGTSTGAAPTTTRVSILAGGSVGIGIAAPLDLLHLAAGGKMRIAKSGDASRYTQYEYAGVNTNANDGYSIKLGGTTKYKFINDRLGIGNTSPAKALHIGDAANVTGNGTIRLQGYSAGGSGNYHDIVSYGDNLTFYRNSTMCLFLQYNGNVGIGTTAPGYTLHGYLSGSGTVAKFQTNGRESNILIQNDAQTWKIVNYDYGNNGTDHLGFHDGTADRLVIGNNGKVGIGTTTPSRLLDVKSTTDDTAWIRASYSSTICEIGAHSAAAYLQSGSGDDIRIAPAGGTKLIVKVDGKIGMGTLTPGDYWGSGSNLVVAGSTNVGMSIVSGTSHTGAIAFADGTGAAAYRGRVEYDHGADKLYLGAGGATQFVLNANGEVGIGTSSPAANLHIYEATTDTPLQITRAANGGNAMIKFETGTTDDWIVGLRNDSTSNFRIYSYGTSSDVFSINRADGKVGIGTTAPSSPLHVYKAIGGTDIKLSAGNYGTNYGFLNLDSITLGLATGNGVRAISINHSNQYVAIGGELWYPKANLHVRGKTILDNATTAISSAVPTTLFVNDQADATIGFGIRAAGSNAQTIIGLDDSDGDKFKISYTTTDIGAVSHFTMDSNGNVGLGVTDPEKRLEVKSDTTYDGILIDVLSAPEIVFRDRGNSDTKIGTGRHGLDDFYIDTYSGNAFAIDGATRNVGIGTTVPGRLLHLYTSSHTYARIQSGATDKNAAVEYYDGTNWMYAGLLANEGGGTGNWAVITGTGSKVGLSVKQDGNVGIGTNAPAFAAASGNTVKGLNIQNVGNDTQASLRLTGHNNTGGTPGQPTYTELLHAGANLRFDINHNGTVRFSISSGGAITFNSAFTFPTADGSNGQVLQTNGSGTLSWSSAGSGTVTGTGSANRISKWTGTSSQGDSNISEDGTSIKFAPASSDAGYFMVAVPNAFNSGWGQNSDTHATWINFYGYQGGTTKYRNLKIGDGKTGTIATFVGSSGNVGIGTATPAHALHVYDTTGNASAILLDGSASNSGFLSFRQSGVEKSYIQYTANSYLRYFAAGGHNFAQNVGINKTVPDSWLHIEDDNSLTKHLLHVKGGGASGAYGVLVEAANGNDLFKIDTLSYKVTMPSGYSVGIGNDAPVSLLHVQKYDSGNYTGEIRVGGSSTAHGILTSYTQLGNTEGSIHVAPGYANSNALFKLRCSTNNTNQLVLKGDGKIGIGTDAPAYLFHVKGAAADISVQSTTGTNRTGFQAANTGGASYFYRESSSGGGAITGSAAYATVVGASAGAYPLQLGTNNAVRLTIDSAGKVGIGTATPAWDLTLYKSGGTLGVVGAGSPRIDVMNTAGSKGLRIEKSADAYSTLTNYDGGAGASLTLQGASAGGNVGIGTTTPAAKLDVNGDVRIGNSTRGHYLGEKALTVNGTTYTTALTIVLSDHNAAHVKLFLTGDWSGHSAVAYVGEYFIQNGAGGYAEPGMIISEFDNTHTDFIESKIVDPSTDTFTIQLKLSDSDNGSLGGHICYHVMGEVTSVT